MFTIIALIFGHILVNGDCYLLAWNMNRLLKVSASPRDILTKLLFWGLIAIMGGFCFFFSRPVWITLYLLIGIAVFLVWREGLSQEGG